MAIVLVIYRQTSNINHTLVGNKIVDHSNVVGASPVGTAPTTFHFQLNTWLQCIAQRQLHDETQNIPVLEFGMPYIRDLMVVIALVYFPTKYNFYYIYGRKKWEWNNILMTNNQVFKSKHF